MSPDVAVDSTGSLQPWRRLGRGESPDEVRGKAGHVQLLRMNRDLLVSALRARVLDDMEYSMLIIVVRAWEYNQDMV